MSTDIIVAVIAFAGTFVGTLGGILAANKLTNYRISKLEERIEKMDTLDERLDKIEIRQSIQEEYITSLRKEMDRTLALIDTLHPHGGLHK